MLIAAYAPLKPPDHAVPSGDRRIARLIADALTLAGHRVEWASRFRTRDASASATRQTRLAAIGEKLAARLVRRYQARAAADRPQAWLTYHLYYKAPDYLGALVAAALNIPYVIVEASIAAKRATGPWAIGHQAALAALQRASGIVSLNPADAAGITPYLAPTCTHHLARPFLDARRYTQAPLGRRAVPRLLAVGMMRSGDKASSYRVLAQALAQIPPPWHLTIIGDGPMRAQIAADFAGFGDQVVFCGACDEAEIARTMTDSDLFVWPAIGEAFGMAILEAQASGLPVIAGAMPGVGAIVTDQQTGLLTRIGDAAAFAAATQRLLRDADLRIAMGRAARAKVMAAHDLPMAAKLFDDILARAA